MGVLSEGRTEVHADPAVTQSSAHSDTPAEHTRPPDPPQVCGV